MGEACSAEERSAYKALTGKPERKTQFDRRSVDERIILKWI
jgi:hypothetical protein